MSSRVLRAALMGVLFPAFTGSASGEDQKSKRELLTQSEEKSVRYAIYGSTLAFAKDERGAFRVVVVPTQVKAAYDKKPRATAELLLRILEGARPEDSMNAAGCIQALIRSPSWAFLSMRRAERELRSFDDIRSGFVISYREFLRRECSKLLAEKQQP